VCVQFVRAEALTTAPVVLACPSRLGTDTLFSRTVVPHPVKRSSSSSDFAAPPMTLHVATLVFGVFLCLTRSLVLA
jgi:hypothetical protein